MVYQPLMAVLIPNYVYTYMILSERFVINIFKRGKSHLFAHSWIVSNIAI